MRKFYLGVAAITMLAMVGCTKETMVWTHKGEPVSFAAVAEGGGLLTKTAYSGEKITENDTNYERIDWISSDVISISYNGNVAEYSVGEGNIDESSRKKSKSSTFVASSSDTLKWGGNVGTHKFYGLFPAPSIAGNIGDVLHRTSAKISGNVITVNLPSVQSQTLYDSGKHKGQLTADPMHYAYMYGYGEAEIESATAAKPEGVDMEFLPIVSTFQFTLKNGSSNPMTIKYVKLSSASKKMTGRYTATINGSSVSCSPSSSSSFEQYVKAEYSGGKTLAAGDTMRVTFFAYPQEYNDLSIEVATDCSYTFSSVEKTIKYTGTKSHILGSVTKNTDGTKTYNYSTFKAFTKNNIKGISIPAATLELSDATLLTLLGSISGVSYNENFSSPAISIDGKYVWADGEILVGKKTINNQDLVGYDTYEEALLAIINALESVKTIIPASTDKFTKNGIYTLTDDGLQWFTNATSIDLSNNNDNRMSYEISNMDKIKSIKATGVYKNLSITNCSSVETIDLKSSNKADMVMLDNLPSLKTLTVDGNAGIGTFYLSNCPNIETLTLNNMQDIPGLYLNGYSKLKTITVTNGKQITDLEITDCDLLETISFTGLTNITSLTLENLPAVSTAYFETGTSRMSNLSYSITKCNTSGTYTWKDSDKTFKYNSTSGKFEVTQ